MKTYKYSVSTETIWTSFDGGTVKAENYSAACTKAEAEVQYHLDITNKALAANPETKGITIDISMDQIQVNEVKKFDHAMNFSFTVLSNSEENPSAAEIRTGLDKALDTLMDDPEELVQRTEIHDTFEIQK